MALFIDDLGPRGSQRQIVELALRLDPSRFAPRVLYYAEPSFHVPKLEAAGIPVVKIDKPSGFAPQAAWSVARECRRCGARLIHAFLIGPNFYGALAARALPGLVSIASERSNWPDRPLAASALEAAGYHLAHAVVANSFTAGERLRREYKVPAAKLHVIPNGVDMARFARVDDRRAEARAEFGVKLDERALLLLGSLAPAKNVPLLVEAFAEARPRLRHRWRLLIVGPRTDAGVVAAVEERIGRFGLQDCVDLHKPIEAVERVLAAADALVLPSKWEGCPNALLEAMAAGRSVIASRVADIPAIVGEDAGLLVPPDDLAALVKAVLQLDALDDDGRRRMGEAGRRRVAERYSMEAMLDATERLYDALLAGKG